MDPDFVEAVLGVVDDVPPGRVTTYGAVARAVGGGPRLVGRVLSQHGDAVAWWRVVRADGVPATCHAGTAPEHLLREGTPMRGSGRVDLAAALWEPAPENG